MPVALLGPAGRLILDRPVYTFGSTPDNQIVLNDLKVSPRHATLQLQGQSYSLIDLGSAEGTYLNEQRLFPNSPAFLKNADRIRIGDSIYTYEESLVSAPDYPSYSPTVLASNTPAYDPTVRASQTPPQSSFTGYGQGTPSSPSYPPAPTPNPAYGQPSPSYPPATPSQGYGQSSPSYPPATPAQGYGQSSPSYPPATPAQGYGQSSPGYPPATPAQGYGQSSPGYPPVDPYAPSNPGFAPVEGQQQPWGGALPPAYQAQPQKKKGGGLKIAVIIIIILLILGGGGGVAGYVLTRPKPVITLTSTYTDGTTPAGATDTSFHVSGTDFTGSSTITFLLDGNPLPGGQTTASDSNGAVSATLTVNSSWTVGNHTLTAKDASGYLTNVGQSLTIVAQGDDKTPGPSGAPTNSASGTVLATYGTDSTITLIITGGSDNGGKVCAAEDDGQPHSTTGSDDNGDTYTDASTYSCTGTYKSGQLDYTETTTVEKLVYSNGVVCTLDNPTIDLHLTGTFTSATAVNGNASSDKATFTCALDGQTAPTSIDAASGAWNGTFTATN